MHKKYSSVFIRKSFDVDDPKVVGELNLMIGYDDYFTAYINGKAVASAKKGSHERKKGKWDTFSIKNPSKFLLPGKNMMAIVGHNIKESSSDFSLDPYLATSGQTVAAPKAAKGKTKQGAAYTVKLYFAEPSDTQVGERVFDVMLAGDVVASGLDIAKEAGGIRRGIVKEYSGIKCNGELDIQLNSKTALKPVLSGIEVIRE